jgi:hypothetical protein
MRVSAISGTKALGAIKRLFMPDDDSHLYAKGIRRGHPMLVVRAQAGEQDRIERMLETRAQ